MNIKKQSSNQALNEWELLQRKKRIQKRNESDDAKKENNHRIFLIGKLAVETIPVLNEIEVFKGKGASVKNNASFAPLKKFLIKMTTDEEMLAQLEQEIKGTLSLEK